jgi:uncharacterized membrane protein YgdD (TMEM256/DUF423 family)
MKTIKYTALLGALAVIIGAFGAHVLKTKLTAEQIESFKTGSQYHFYHVIVLLILGFAYLEKPQSTSIRYAKKLFFIGTLLFSGSIYLLSTKDITNLPFIPFIAPITPLGGLLLIGGWFSLFIAFFRKEKK